MADCTLVPPEVVPSIISRGAPHQAVREASTSEGRKLNTHEFCQHPVIYCRCWGLLHAPKLGHGADYLTSPPKEGMLRGLNLQTREPEASMPTTRPPKLSILY
jgi:hypothetical protein